MLSYIQSAFFSKVSSLNSLIITDKSSIDEADCLVHDHLRI